MPVRKLAASALSFLEPICSLNSQGTLCCSKLHMETPHWPGVGGGGEEMEWEMR